MLWTFLLLFCACRWFSITLILEKSVKRHYFFDLKSKRHYFFDPESLVTPLETQLDRQYLMKKKWLKGIVMA